MSMDADTKLREAAKELLDTFDQLRSATRAERIITGVSDADLRKRAEKAMENLRASLNSSEEMFG